MLAGARCTWVITLALLGLGVAPLSAAAPQKIAPALHTELGRAAANQLIPIIVMLEDQADLERLNAELYAAGRGRRQRAEIVITALQEIATTSQPPLRARLATWRAAGQVADIHPFWLINALALRATPPVVRQIAARLDVERVFLDGVLELDQPIGGQPATAAPGQAEIGLRVVNAPALWERGLTGDGIIVMNIDTGVQGDHPALADRWLGNDPGIPAAEAWFDPFQQACATPCDYRWHGTITMGPLTGLDPATADTIGVAFGAKWIAAATVRINGPPPFTSLCLQAFEWAVDAGVPDPHRPPADVICCAWLDGGITIEQDCGPDGTYWQVIDAFEAIGGAVVYSAGNEGPAAATITKPKNRISSPVNIWATGAIAAHQPGFPIAGFSSRGPSRCDEITIKPEAVAPGVDVRSCVPGGYFQTSGTSLAAPHVAGVIALLMEAFPAATGSEIKLALLATARDLGDPGEDNAYGNGLIDAGAAYDFLLGASAAIEPGSATEPRAPTATLAANVPNPFNPSTTISYQLSVEAAVTLRVYNLRGRLVTTIIDGEHRPPGNHSVRWDGTTASGARAASGMYALKLDAHPAGGDAGRRMVRLRKAVLIR